MTWTHFYIDIKLTLPIIDNINNENTRFVARWIYLDKSTLVRRLIYSTNLDKNILLCGNFYHHNHPVV